MRGVTCLRIFSDDEKCSRFETLDIRLVIGIGCGHLKPC